MTSTVTQKGQVLIPKEIRDKLGIKPNDKLLVRYESGTVVMSPVPTLNDMYGAFVPKQKLTKNKIKEAITTARASKFK